MHSEHFCTREVCRLSGLSQRAVRAFVQAGIVGDVQRKGRTPHRFGFRDLKVLRMARSLIDQGVSQARVCRTLASVQQEVAKHRVPLSAARCVREGGQIVASDAKARWEAESGRPLATVAERRGPDAQLMSLAPRPEGSSSPLAELTSSALPAAGTCALPGHAALGQADHWFNLALDAEEADPRRAYGLYMRALSCDPEHVEAVINVGRLCSADNDPGRAAAFFRLAVRLDPAHPVAHFNLAVMLHDAGKLDVAMRGYRQALAYDNTFADAHFNLGTLLERLGRSREAAHHFAQYRAASEQKR